jgi:hypothetical protein
MKSQPKSPLTQLNLPLLDHDALPLPGGKEQQLMQALIEMLLGAANASTPAEGEAHESQADC